ncbi:MAG: PAAR domain-containing protein, partial [Desulfatitalea sp.]
MPGQGRIGDKAKGVDSHRCNACPHVVSGPATQGSSDVIVNGKPAVRKGDGGVHTACCGSNIWTANGGSDTVFINGKQAFRLGDATDHCGGAGMLVEASGNVFVGNSQARAFIEAAKSHAPFVCNCSQPTGVPY